MRLEQISNTRWKQHFRDRKKEFHLWSSHKAVSDYCELENGTKRLLLIQFEEKYNIDILDWFQITSGREVSFPKILQEIVRPIVLNNPDSYFTIEVKDVCLNEEVAQQFSTTGSATISIRVGQDKFRKELIKFWKGSCAVTGLSLLDILKASHIKPWSESTDEERIDKYNGLLLDPKIDALFDIGLISFSDAGRVILSKEVLKHVHLLGVDKKSSVSISEEHKKYLKYHREKVFKG